MHSQRSDATRAASMTWSGDAGIRPRVPGSSGVPGRSGSRPCRCHWRGRRKAGEQRRGDRTRSRWQGNDRNLITTAPYFGSNRAPSTAAWSGPSYGGTPPCPLSRSTAPALRWIDAQSDRPGPGPRALLPDDVEFRDRDRGQEQVGRGGVLQARATCCGEASRRAARLVSVPDWSGVKPPRGKNEATSRDGAHRQEVGLVGFEGHLTRYRAAIS
jgi:hypothetical protein